MTRKQLGGYRLKCRICNQFFRVCYQCFKCQKYCKLACRKKARSQSLKAAKCVYEKTHEAKRLHSLRQARYRARLRRKKVTHHSCPPSCSFVIKHSRNLDMNQSEASSTQNFSDSRCCKCGREVVWLSLNPPTRVIRKEDYEYRRADKINN